MLRMRGRRDRTKLSMRQCNECGRARSEGKEARSVEQLRHAKGMKEAEKRQAQTTMFSR